ncbi:hypothetical protein Hanom_Chr04g00338121 [Helianthus anomalus]
MAIRSDGHPIQMHITCSELVKRCIIRSDDHPIGDHQYCARAYDWHPAHNIYCILDENYENMGPLKDMTKFLRESMIAKALTDRMKVYESHVRMFWRSVRYEESEKTIYSAVQKKDENDHDIDVKVKFNVGDVRRVLDLGDSDDDPTIVPKRLCKGLWFRMTFSAHVNDKYLKSMFSRPYIFLVHSITS